MSRQAWLGSLLALAVAIVLIISSRSISEFLYGLFFQPNTARTEAFVVATLIDKNGLIFIRRAGQIEFNQARPPLDFYHLDQIKVERAAKAEIQFKSDWKLDIQENTIATFELYRPNQADSPALISITKGNYAVTQPGAKGKLFVMRDKKVFTPQTPLSLPVRTVRLHPPQPAAPVPVEAISDVVLSISQIPTPALPSATKPGKMPDKLASGDEETLSSAYIEQILNAQSTALRKCQQNSLRDNKPSTGSLLLSLTISPNGKIERAKVLQDQIKNEQLASCAVSVIERVVFKSFEGLPISLTYPLEFK